MLILEVTKNSDLGRRYSWYTFSLSGDGNTVKPSCIAIIWLMEITLATSKVLMVE